MELHSDKAFGCNEDHEKKHDMMLDLSLSAQKSDNLFAGSDQTPTPTRLIRNCEEVGLFEDLQHVNPFEETFRRAVEQNTGQTPALPNSVESHADENSLHTPQVFPQLESGNDAGSYSCVMSAKPLDSPPSAAVTLDVPAVDDLLRAAADDAFKLSTSRQNSNNSTTSSSSYGKFYKYRCITEKPLAPAATPVTLPATTLPLTTNCAPTDTQLPFMQLPTIQLIQPQVITLTFPDSTSENSSKTRVSTAQAIPIQTVKPFIMPKLATSSNTITTGTSNTSSASSQQHSAPTLLPTTAASTCVTSSSNTLPQQPLHEPSSASLTPTSQLPIKERLKAILSNSNKSQRAVELIPPKECSRRACGKYDDDCIVRKRAAAMRYRNKMRNEHKELRRRNGELEMENEKLRLRVKQLEQDLSKLQQQPFVIGSDTENMLSMPAQIQIPPSTLQVVMNIPNMVVPMRGQPILMQPITYRVEKK